MPKPSHMLRQMNAKNEAKYALEFQRKMDILLQMCCDAALIAVNDVFGAGPTRAQRFRKAFQDNVNEIARMTVDAAKDDDEIVYVKAKLDERLKQICGDEFKPWEERYPHA